MTIKVFKARRIITMNPSWPEGTAVAVRDGRILEVGTMESLQPWLERDEFVEHDFGYHVLLPMRFVTAFEWTLPWQSVQACPDEASYRHRLAELEAETPAGEPFFSWGYHGSCMVK